MMTSPPFVKEHSTKEAVSQGRGKLITVKGHWTPKGQTYKGKEVLSGIFVNVTSKSEQEKVRLFALAKEEIGEHARGLDLYEVIDV